ncbi:hypothetical protein HDU96_005948 [Phlyctochytrium bullatum]|nr:hypothetical protein HDU96_005948 [Phlyctochytrium bullatum]
MDGEGEATQPKLAEVKEQPSGSAAPPAPPIPVVVVKEEPAEKIADATSGSLSQAEHATENIVVESKDEENAPDKPQDQMMLDIPQTADDQTQSNQTTVENNSGKETSEQAVVAGRKRSRGADDGKPGFYSKLSPPKRKMDEDAPKKKKGGLVIVQNDELLTRIPSNIEPKSLGYVIYTGAHTRDKMSDNPKDYKLFLLPHNCAVRSQALWGTDIYTDDSDIVAVIVHSGYYHAVDQPPEVQLEEAQVPDASAAADTGSISGAGKDESVAADSKVPTETDGTGPDTTSSAVRVESSERQLPKPPQHPLIAKKDPINPRLALHDLSVTLRVLPRLNRYTGSSRNGISSKGWGSSHDGESIRVEKIEPLPRGSVVRRGRKRGCLEWCTLGLVGRRKEALNLPSKREAAAAAKTHPDHTLESTDYKRSKKRKEPPKVAKKQVFNLVEDSVTLVFSPFGGHACIKYQSSVLMDWPSFLREALRDFRNIEKADNGSEDASLSAPGRLLHDFEADTGFTVADLKKWEKLPYWAVRLKKDVLYLETPIGDCHDGSDGGEYQIQQLVSITAGTREKAVVPIPSDSTDVKIGSLEVYPLQSISWKAAGLDLGKVSGAIPVARIFWKRRSES